MRGEHFRAELKRGGYPGSSPHARGTPSQHSGSHVSIGIIPACAGNTKFPSAMHNAIRDHPRMRGEHRQSLRINQYMKGSSPHARGTPMMRGMVILRPGIIPACAGNTIAMPRSLRESRDHPRMRGEHQHVTVMRDISLGIIPACAGNTCPCPKSARNPWDHPRMRGEHSKKIA